MSGIEAFVLDYLVNSLWQVPLVCIAAWGCARLARRMSAEAEHCVWVGVLLASVALPACAFSGAWMPYGLGTHAAGAGTVQVQMGQYTPVTGASLHLPPVLRHAVVIAYLALTLFFCARLLWGLIESERLRRSARTFAPEGEWGTAWQRLCRVFGACDVEIATTPKIAGPLTLGLWQRWLLVPPEFLETAEATDVEAALGHELAHIHRRDFAKNVLYELIALPLSYHPAARWVKAQIRQSRELVCDAMAAEFVTTREDYARSLLRLASLMLERAPAHPIHAIGIFDANILERRVMSLMKRPRETRGVLRMGIAAVCVLVGAATCGSALALRLDVNEPPPPTAATQTEAAAKAEADAKVVRVKGAVVAGNRISGENSTYPPEAREKHVSGIVILRAVISKTGQVEKLAVVSGPEMFQASAIDAVRTWKYKPFLLNGNPTAVETTININYNLGK